ncbi:uncharacterized protein LOC124360735 [Homalodisca vitripennis]|uniref:uncharacterized protein LOC124360735 n=1 Tax=Homalodisca vitripennis TaxID=197043 RepID=UPI001EEB3D04|nr:uncharacterized protein LOC124360735 [Homalodisca vitripennis]
MKRNRYEESIRNKWTNIRDCYQRKWKQRQRKADEKGTGFQDYSNENGFLEPLGFLDRVLKKSQNLKYMESAKNKGNEVPNKSRLSKLLNYSDDETEFNFRLTTPPPRKDMDNADPQFSLVKESDLTKSNQRQNGDIDNSRDASPTKFENVLNEPEFISSDSDDDDNNTKSMPLIKKEEVNDNIQRGNEQTSNSFLAYSDHGSDSGVERMPYKNRHRSIKRRFEEEEQVEETKQELNRFFNNEILPFVTKHFNKRQILEFKSSMLILVSNTLYPEMKNE